MKGEKNLEEKIPPPCLGNFTPLRPVEDSDLLAEMVHVPCKSGSMVLWDNRIGRSNADPGRAEGRIWVEELERRMLNMAQVVDSWTATSH